jgi:hypothetical protein
MKRLFACLPLLFFIQLSRAQNDPAATNFIRSVISEKKVVYTDSLGSYDGPMMKKMFGRELANSIAPMRNKLPISIFHFTKQEVDYINTQLYLLGSVVWKPGLLENSRLISEATVDKIFKNSLAKGWRYFYKHYGTQLYSFGKPIFLRNNAMCIFYSGYHCGGLCGTGSLCIYVKENGRWKNKYTILTWMS